MKIKFIALFITAAFTFTSCGGEKKKDDQPVKEEVQKEEPVKEEVTTTSEEIDLTAPTLDNKGVGSITNLTLDAVDEKLAEKGKALFKTNCTSCHKFKKKLVGPALKGVTERRSPEWIMNMILNPGKMVKEDPVAKALLEKYLSPMSNQSLSEEDARAILEYFRSKDKS